MDWGGWFILIGCILVLFVFYCSMAGGNAWDECDDCPWQEECVRENKQRYCQRKKRNA